MLNWKSNHQANMPNQPKQHQIKRINQYMFDVYDEIGRGYSSIVYEGKNLLTGHKVAIKAIQIKKIKNEIEKKLLNNQIKALKSLDHPNILRAIEVLQTSNHFYVVTQFYESSLEDVLKQKQKYSEKQILYFIQKMGQVLCYLQQKSLIHRDIKPSNIFVQSDQIILGDFGFCSFRNPYQLYPQNVHYNVGSPLYMSPQSFKNSVYSIKSDVWSLGICIIELIVGHKPFMHSNYDQMIRNLESEEFINNLPTSEMIKSILRKIFYVDPFLRAYPSEILRILTNTNNKSEKCILGLQSNKFLTDKVQPIIFKNNHQRKFSQLPLKSNRVHCRKLSEKQSVTKLYQSPQDNCQKQNIRSLSKDTTKNIPHNSVSPQKIIHKNYSTDRMFIHNKPMHKTDIKIVNPLTQILNQFQKDQIIEENTFKINLIKFLLHFSPPMANPSEKLSRISVLKTDDSYLKYILTKSIGSSWRDHDQYLMFLLEKCAIQATEMYDRQLITKQQALRTMKKIHEFYVDYKEKQQMIKKQDRKILERNYIVSKPELSNFEQLYKFWVNKK